MNRGNNELIGILFVTVLVSVLLISIPAALGDSTGTMAAAIERRYDFAEPAIGPIVLGEHEYDTVSIPGCDMYGAPGEPVLPVKTARIMIPYGEEVRDIQVIPGKEIYLGQFYIEPGQAQVPIGSEAPIMSTPPNETTYNSTDIYPKEVYSKVSVQGVGGYQILILNLYPVKYVPKARKLSYFVSMQVIVNTTDSSPDTPFRGSPEDRTRVAEIIDNPEALSTYNSAHVHTATQQSELDLTYDFAEPVIGKPVIGKIAIGEQEYDTVSIPGCDMYGAPGEPVLPVKTARILIPYGEEVRDIQVISGKEIYLGEFYIEPGQEQVPISFTGPIAPTQPDEVIYNSDKPYPEEDYFEVSVQGMQGYQILILNLYPVKYVPKARKLSCFETMQVVVSTTASAPSELFRGIPEDRAEVAEIIDNPDALSTYDPAKASNPERSPLSPEYDYVIITNEALLGTTGPSNFQALRDSKIANGLSATIVTTEWIYANYVGLDNQTEIRNFIIDAYSNWDTSYVLLGGDGDGADVGGESGNAIIPARGFWTGLTGDECTPPNIPADMYYSCLDGTFDHNGNGIYGEPWDGPDGGEVDLLAEVYVGRAPVDSSTEVSNFVKKTLAYESAAFVPKALMVGEYLGWIPGGGDYKDEVKDGSANWSYTTVGFPQPPFAVDTLYDRDYPGNWPAYVLIDRLNNNPNIVNHMGHANPTYVMKLSNSNVDALTNSNYFFGWTQGCYAGSFDNRWSNCNYGSSDCILEHFVVDDHGAVAFIGNSRYGWGNVFTTNGASQRFDRQFWDAVFGGGITRIGMANADSKEDNAGLISDAYIRFCYYELNLLGDPAVSIVLSAAEPPKIVSFAPASPVNDAVGNWRTFNVTVDQRVNVSWYLNGSFLFTNDSVQEANCRLHAEVAGEHNVSAIASNANGTDMQVWVWTIPSPCFIATAAYGTPLHDDITVLRVFRDEYLMRNSFGRTFVKIYYSTSPPIADLIRENDGLRLIVREGVVKTSVYVARRFVN